jgi:hypothetical protein
MPKAGDRIVVEGSKVGGGRREGTLLGTVGSLIRVRWADGGESIMAPGAGAIRILPGNSKSKPAPAAKAVRKAKPARKSAGSRARR